MQCPLELFRFVLVFTVLIGASANASAQADRNGDPRSKSDSHPAGARDRMGQNQISDEECRAFGLALAKAVSAGDLAAVNALIDWDVLFEKALAGMSMTQPQHQSIITELKGSVGLELGFTGQLVKNAKAGTELTFLRPRQSRGSQVAQFRMSQTAGEGGVNYLEFVVKRSADGKVRAMDVYPFMTAEYLSATFRRALLPVISSLSRTFLDKLLTNEQDVVRDLPKLQEFVSLIGQGKNQQALVQFAALRPETKKEKWVLMLRLRAAQDSDEKEYAAVLEDFRTLYPKDPCLDMILIDYHTLKKDYSKAIESVDRLDQAVGGDPYLNTIRANLSEASGDLAAAEKFARLAIDGDPTVQGYFYLIGITMAEKKYGETLAALKKQDQAFKMVYKDLKTVPLYAGFVQSPEYKDWLEYLAQKAKKTKAAPVQTPAETQKSRTDTKKAGSSS
jgi:hypothetical protein